MGQFLRTRRAAVATKPITMSLRLPAELMGMLDAIAEAEGRSRSKQIEMFLRQCVQDYPADPLARHLAPPTARERAVRGAGRRA